MSRYNSRWSRRTISQFINGKQKRFNLIRHTKNLERGVGKKVSASFTVQLYNDRLNGVTGTWGVAHITALRHVLALSPLWVTTLHNHLLGFSLVYEKPEASSSLFDHLPDVRSQRFHPTLFWLNQGGPWYPHVPTSRKQEPAYWGGTAEKQSMSNQIPSYLFGLAGCGC